jgi:hypothetical protein
VGGGVQLGPLGTAATNSPIVPAPDEYGDGEIGGIIIDRGNLSTRRKTAPVPLYPPQTPYALPGREPGPPRWEASDWPLELWHRRIFHLVSIKFINFKSLKVHVSTSMVIIRC